MALKAEPESDATALARAITGLNRRLRAQQPEGALSLTGLGVLRALERLGPMPTSRLATEERLQPQSLTRIVAELERGALIRRRRNPADRRALIVEITPIGRHMLASDPGRRHAWLDQAMTTRLTVAERAVLRVAAYLMQKLAANADV
jgi:DNA-binding MarR family transcriptional regulator